MTAHVTAVAVAWPVGSRRVPVAQGPQRVEAMDLAAENERLRRELHALRAELGAARAATVRGDDGRDGEREALGVVALPAPTPLAAASPVVGPVAVAGGTAGRRAELLARLRLDNVAMMASAGDALAAARNDAAMMGIELSEEGGAPEVRVRGRGPACGGPRAGAHVM